MRTMSIIIQIHGSGPHLLAHEVLNVLESLASRLGHIEVGEDPRANEDDGEGKKGERAERSGEERKGLAHNLSIEKTRAGVRWRGGERGGRDAVRWRAHGRRARAQSWRAS